jgi:pyrrolidone-carboxylate peptidase
MILFYAFSNQWGTNVSRRVLLEIQKLLPQSNNLIFRSINFHPKSFYQKYIYRSHYDLIVGLGDYFGEISKIRIETKAFNKYGNENIDSFTPVSLEISMPVLDLVDNSKFSVSEHMGTYNCNWIVFQIEKEIISRSTETKQLFFHLPKKAKADCLAADIINLLQANLII